MSRREWPRRAEKAAEEYPDAVKAALGDLGDLGDLVDKQTDGRHHDQIDTAEEDSRLPR